MSTFLDDSPLADNEVVGTLTIPCISPVPANRRLSLTQIFNFVKGAITLASLSDDKQPWLQEFLGGGDYEGGEADARGALGVDPAGTALAQFEPLYTAFTTLIDELHIVAFSGNIVDLTGVNVPMEDLINATTQAEARAAIGAAAPGVSWRSVTPAESENVDVLDTDSAVLFEIGPMLFFQINLPVGAFDGQVIRLVATDTLDSVSWRGQSLINPEGYGAIGPFLRVTIAWNAGLESWIRIA